MNPQTIQNQLPKNHCRISTQGYMTYKDNPIKERHNQYYRIRKETKMWVLLSIGHRMEYNIERNSSVLYNFTPTSAASEMIFNPAAWQLQ